MLRSRLKNIINKSKEISNKQQIVGEPFDKFLETLPKELLLNENYRMKAAWKAYGSPKDYKEAIWEGMIQPIDENTYKLPSIGYNEETEEYEYLNKGKENETVAKDIRVWDNDVIPLVLELKRGGYVRIFNEEKDCWTYSKNTQKENPVGEDQGSILLEEGGEINSFLKGGKSEEEIPSFLKYNPETDSYTSTYYSDDNKAEDINWYRSKNSKKFRKKYKLNDIDWEDGEPDGKFFTYIPKKKYNELYFNKYGFKGIGGGGFIYQDPNGEIGDGQPLKATGQYTLDGQELYEGLDGLLYTLRPQAFKQGGQMSVIPEGALHAHKNHMEGAGEDFTAKGIPVVDNNGELQAEIERNEIIFRKEVTDKIEELYKKFNNEETSNDEKDKIAIEMGKILTCEITKHTDDKTGLIEKILNS